MTDQPGYFSKTEILLGITPEDRPRIYLLGGFRIVYASGDIRSEQIRLRRARDLLKLLALAPDHRLHHELVMELLWPDHDPAKTAHSLNQILYRLRPILARLESTFTIRLVDEYLLLTAEAGIWTDVEAFEQAARAVRLQPDLAEFQAVLMIYQGDLLPEDPYSDLFTRRREELKATRLFLLKQLAAYHTSQREHTQAVELLQMLVEADPANEESHVLLVGAYENSGHHHLALRQYQKMIEIIHREFGAEPSRESQALYGRLAAAHAEAGRPPEPST